VLPQPQLLQQVVQSVKSSVCAEARAVVDMPEAVADMAVAPVVQQAAALVPDTLVDLVAA